MSKRFSILLVVLALMTVVISCGKDKKVQNENDQVKLQREKIVKEITGKYNAITDWDKGILYTIQLQDIFLSDRLVMVVGYINDVYKKDGQFYIRFIKSMSMRDFKDGATFGLTNEPEVNFILKCDSVKVSRIFSNLSNKEIDDLKLGLDMPIYAVVAKINDVTKPTLQIDGNVSSDNTVEWNYEPPQTFIATGDCIDLVYVGQEFP
jgi:hypothetical protein